MDINSIKQNMLVAGKGLAIFAIVASALVAITFEITKNRIAENEKQALLKSLFVLVPPEQHDNDMYVDNVQLDVPELNYRNKAITVYRARKDDKPVAAIFNVTAPDGYSGPIKLLIAIDSNQQVIGVRAITHKETPGLGDAIDIEKSDWIRTFEGKSLSNPMKKQWRVKKDGGVFDQLTGATITPRAIVNTTLKTLQYFNQHSQQVFAKLEGTEHVE